MQEETVSQRNSAIATNSSNNSSLNSKEEEIEGINVPKIMKRKIMSSEKNQSKRSKNNKYHGKENESQTLNKIVISEEATLIAGIVGNGATEDLVIKNDILEKTSPEESDPIALAGFENDSQINHHFNETQDGSVDEESFAGDITNKHDIDSNNHDIVVSESSPVSHGHKVRRMKVSKRTKLTINSEHVENAEHSKRKDKHQQLTDGSQKLTSRKTSVELQTIKQLGALVNMQLKILKKDGFMNFSLHPLRNVLLAQS